MKMTMTKRTGQWEEPDRVAVGGMRVLRVTYHHQQDYVSMITLVGEWKWVPACLHFEGNLTSFSSLSIGESFVF